MEENDREKRNKMKADKLIEETKQVSQSMESASNSQIALGYGSFSSPLPPPQLLRDYENSIEGAGLTCIKMIEQEQRHRHEMEKAALEGNIATSERESKTTMRSQYLTFFLGLAMIGVTAFLLYHGKTIAGIVALAGTIMPSFLNILKTYLDRK